MNWKNRWCVVKEHSLFCYKDFGIGTAELQAPLRGASVKLVVEGSDSDDKQHVFVLMGEKEELLFAAENDAEQEEWIMVLNDEIKSIENFPSKCVLSGFRRLNSWLWLRDGFPQNLALQYKVMLII